MDVIERKKFNEYVVEMIIKSVKEYDKYFVKKTYLLCSGAFVKKPYYIVKAGGYNFLHLTGVHAYDSAWIFYRKAITGVLTTKDFDFVKPNLAEKQIRYFVRGKMRVFPYINNMFSHGVLVQEDLKRSSFTCSVAASDKLHFTLGFIYDNYLIPLSLMDRPYVNDNSGKPLDVVLSKSRVSEKFDTIEVGDLNSLTCHYPEIKNELSDTLRTAVETQCDLYYPFLIHAIKECVDYLNNIKL